MSDVRELVINRLALLRREREQMQANLFAFDGAIQNSEWLLSQLEEPDDQIASDTDDSVGETEREGAGPD